MLFAPEVAGELNITIMMNVMTAKEKDSFRAGNIRKRFGVGYLN